MRRLVLLVTVATLASLIVAPAGARAPWKRRIDRLARHRDVAVSVRIDGDNVYRRRATRRMVPASNQKLLLSMALFDYLGPGFRLVTRASAGRTRRGTIPGNLWLLGSGDPAVSNGGPFADSIGFGSTRLGTLARRIEAAGVRRIEGRVVGATNYFTHDWFAPGWKSYFPTYEVALPTALTFDGNTARGRHIADPERRAAVSLTNKLEQRGVKVAGKPTAKAAPAGLDVVASIQSSRLRTLVRHMNHVSSNFFAEVLGKRLAVERYGRPGSIAKAAKSIRRWALRRGVSIDARDASGLSYKNRVSPQGITRLIDRAEEQPWGSELRATLPHGGRGTLEDRLRGVKLHAKTGTLVEVSALSGYLWLERRGTWASFSMISRGLPKYKAVTLEDRTVKLLARRAR
jgi:serine-type D-Ala-D-Ala carboxypeptidase/endopeptidase (penicillin-binding protein 4)